MAHQTIPVIQRNTNVIIQVLLLILLALLFSQCEDDKPRTDDGTIPPPDFEVDSTRTDLDRSTRPFRTSYDGQIIDTHVHLDPPEDGIDTSALREIIQVIEDANVSFAIFMPTPNDGRNDNHEEGATQRETLFNLDHGKVKLFCCSNYTTYWLDQAYRDRYTESELDTILLRLSSDFDVGNIAGAGEIGLYHFNKTGSQPVIEYPPNFEPFLSIVDIISEKDTWLDLHAEPVDPDGVSYEKEVFGGLALLFERYPNLKLILSHTAMTNPNNVRSILRTYQTVMMNIKIKTNHDKWKNLEPVVNTEGELYEDWAELFEEMPERFMIGTDSKFGRSSFETSDYLTQIEEERAILGSIDSDAASKIAYENAASIFE